MHGPTGDFLSAGKIKGLCRDLRASILDGDEIDFPRVYGIQDIITLGIIGDCVGRSEELHVAICLGATTDELLKRRGPGADRDVQLILNSVRDVLPFENLRNLSPALRQHLGL